MLESVISSPITITSLLICTAVSVLLGFGTAFVSMYKQKCSQSFSIALVLLPVLIQVVILLVNGNIGAGVAVAGAFSLIRFRSAPGSAREICEIFLAMVIGIATGMGYIGIAVIFFIVAGALIIVLSAVHFGENTSERVLSITIPENMDYEGLFDDLLSQYTLEYYLERVKTTNMGTLYELRYIIVILGQTVPKEFLDALRCRNGNLNIVCSKETYKEAL